MQNYNTIMLKSNQNKSYPDPWGEVFILVGSNWGPKNN